MKAKLILAHTFLLLITMQYMYGQKNSCCNCTDKTYSERGLPGELFTQTVDVITYIDKYWHSGDIVLTDGETIRNKLIRYNGLLDELFWLEPHSKKTIKLDKEAILQFHFQNLKGDTSVYFRKIIVKREGFADSSEIFGQEIYHGKLSLFILHSFIVDRKEIFAKKGVYYQQTLYIQAPVYYFRFMNNKTVGFKSLNRKSLYGIAPDKKDQIRKFFKENNQGKIKNNSELILLTQFLSSIVNQ